LIYFLSVRLVGRSGSKLHPSKSNKENGEAPPP
jgi:hypothetical protein